MPKKLTSTARLLPLLLLGAGPALADGQQCLTELEAQLERRMPEVQTLLPHQFTRLQSAPRSALVLDAREQKEFEVAHIPGAVRVEPGLTADAFLERFGTSLEGRPVVIYCSVGVRSSKLARRIETAARKAGAQGVYNLRGGIFAWHNYGLTLADRTGSTQSVHPYSRSWSRYLDFPNYARYTPIEAR